MKLLIFGRNGQVASELAELLKESAQSVFAEYKILGSDQVDFKSNEAIKQAIQDFSPSHIINAAAYTAVDRAESEKSQAMQINATAVGVIGAAAKKLNAFVLHYSTDYVFDGQKETPYLESDSPRPINYYGETKFQGEQALQASGCDCVILRVSWVYGKFGNNFYKTMLRLGGERELLRVVSDQHGAPTSSRNIAEVSLRILSDSELKTKNGIYHLSPAGETTWYGFAEAIFAKARAGGLALKIGKLEPIPASAYPTPAPRPTNSRMNADKINAAFGIKLANWEESLRKLQA